jgi:hypothetical protein
MLLYSPNTMSDEPAQFKDYGVGKCCFCFCALPKPLLIYEKAPRVFSSFPHFKATASLKCGVIFFNACHNKSRSAALLLSR